MIVLPSGEKYPSPARTKSVVTCLTSVRWAASSLAHGAGSEPIDSASTSGSIESPLETGGANADTRITPVMIPGPSHVLGASERPDGPGRGPLDSHCGRGRPVGRGRGPLADRHRPQRAAP